MQCIWKCGNRNQLLSMNKIDLKGIIPKALTLFRHHGQGGLFATNACWDALPARHPDRLIRADQ